MRHNLNSHLAILFLMAMGNGILQAQQLNIVRLTGQLKSSNSTEVKCELEAPTTIESIVEEGTKVKGPTDYKLKAGDTLESIAREHDKYTFSIQQLNEGLGLDWDNLPAGRMIKIPGNLLAELDPLSLKERITSQEISVLRTENALTRAQGNLEEVKLVTALGLKQAEIEHRLALAALKNFEENEMKTILEDLQGQVEVAKAKIQGAEKILKLDAKDDPAIQVEIINALAALLDAQRILKLAKANLKQFQEHHAPQKITKLELTSDLALVEIEKTKRNNVANLRDADLAISTQEKTMAMEKEKLQDLEEQMANTRIYAPANGTVVYFTERYGDFGPIMKGAKVHKGRNIMKILNSNKMMVDLNVPQSMRAYLRQGQKAVVTCVDTKIETTLSYISSTMDSNRRGQIDKSYFRGEIQITNPPETLFEGMSVLVEIPTGLPPTRN